MVTCECGSCVAFFRSPTRKEKNCFFFVQWHFEETGYLQCVKALVGVRHDQKEIVLEAQLNVGLILRKYQVLSMSLGLIHLRELEKTEPVLNLFKCILHLWGLQDL
jgi:hypothetical protein